MKSIFILVATLLFANVVFSQCVTAYSKVTTENGEMYLSGKIQVCDGTYKSVVADNGTTYYVTSAAYDAVPAKYKPATKTTTTSNCVTVYTTWDGGTLNSPTQSCDGSVYPTITTDNGTTVYVTQNVYQAYQSSISSDNSSGKKKRKESNTGVSVGVNFDNWTKTVNAGVTLTNKRTGDNVTISVNGIGAGKYGRQTPIPIIFAGGSGIFGNNPYAYGNTLEQLQLQQMQQLQLLQYGTGLHIYDPSTGLPVIR